MTLDQLFLDAGEQIDRLIDDHLVAQPAAAEHVSQPRRRIGAIAAAALLVIAGLGVTWLVVQRDHASPTPSAAPSLFDNGVAMVVFMRNGSAPEQVDLVRQQILQQDAVIDTSRIEYLDASQSLALARRLFADDPATLANVEPRLPTVFRLHTTPAATPDQLTQLRSQLLQMPNVIDVRTPGSATGSVIPVDAPGSNTPTPTPTLAPLPSP